MIRLNRFGVTPVVHLNRRKKAQMIERVLYDFLGEPVVGKTILDIGSGNGDISQYFSAKNNQFGVDVNDQRKLENRDFGFIRVDSEILPYGDDTFDLVLSNHVIEHVRNQSLHLNEIRRVLKPDGVVYIATPNKSSPFMKGHLNNDQVLRYVEMAALFEACGYQTAEYTCRMIHEPERLGLEFTAGRFLPMWLLTALCPLIPSHTFVLKLA